MLSSWTWGESSDNRPAVPWNKSQRAQYARSAPRRSCFHDAVDTLQQLSQLTCSPCTAAAPTKDIKEIYGASMNRITWEQWPAGVHPKDGGLPSSRLLRKIEQIESMLLICMHLIDMIRPLRVVEFCGGSGYIVLPLAALYPDIEFVLIDYKAESIARASHRLKTSRMSNVRIIEGDIGEYEEVFQLGIALHACGGATDMSMIKCLKQSAGFVMCPCCIGKVLTSRSQGLSKQFAGQLSDTQFKHLAKAADSHHEGTLNMEQEAVRRRCKLMLEQDRCMFAEEQGYTTLTASMAAWASPKRDVIAGWVVR